MKEPAAPWLPIAAVALAFQAAFIGGATAYWSQGLSVALIGLALLVLPPERRLGRWLEIVLLALLVWSAVPLLQERWLGVVDPAWRADVRDYAADLPRTISPQPWLTAEGWLFFLAGLAAFYWFGTMRWEDGRRGRVVRLAAGAAAAFAATCLLFRAFHYAPSSWHNDWHFGPFPSRNHTGNLLAVGTLLCGGCMVAYWERQRPRAYWFAGGMALCGLALVIDLSRGAMLAAGVTAIGGTAWLWWRRRFRPSLALALAVIVLAGASGVYFRARDPGKFVELVPGSAGELLRLRGELYRDATRMIAREPLAGTGFGNFEAIFPAYRSCSAPVRFIHPESDWFWAGVEMGWPGIVLLASGVAALVVTALRRNRTSSGRSAAAAAAAVCVVLVHSIVDVPGHLFGTLLPALLLAGVVIAGDEQPRPAHRGRLLFRLLGVLLVCIGGALLVGRGPSHRAMMALREAESANRSKGYPRAEGAAAAGLLLAPLSWELRFQRGIAEVGASHVEEAQASFKCARLLQPGEPSLPEAEAAFWMLIGRSLPLAEAAWREALACDPNGQRHVFKRLLDAAHDAPALHDFAREEAFKSPDRFADYLRTVEPPKVAADVAARLERDPELKDFGFLALRKTLEVWAERNLASAAETIQKHPKWRRPGWRVTASYLGEQRRFEEACAVARQYLAEPKEVPAIDGSREELRLRLLREPDDVAAALGLSRLEERAGDLAMARFALRSALEQKEAPNPLLWRAAELATRAGEHEMAWMALRRYGRF